MKFCVVDAGTKTMNSIPGGGLGGSPFIGGGGDGGGNASCGWACPPNSIGAMIIDSDEEVSREINSSCD